MSFGFCRSLAAATPLLFLFACNPRVTTIGESLDVDAETGVYIEAESGALSDGFLIGDDPAASGEHFIYSAVGVVSDTTPGPARAAYELSAPAAGNYLLWGRIHSQTIYENRIWFQIDGGEWIKWRITTGDIWFWDALHDNISYGVPYPLPLSAGVHRLVLANCTDDAQLDRLYFAADGVPPQGNDTKCNPPHSVDLDGGCAKSCGSLGGHCGGTLCTADLPVLSATYDCPACCAATAP